MSDGGKGSQQRPTDPQKFGDGFDRIFGKQSKGCDRCAKNVCAHQVAYECLGADPNNPLYLHWVKA